MFQTWLSETYHAVQCNRSVQYNRKWQNKSQKKQQKVKCREKSEAIKPRRQLASYIWDKCDPVRAVMMKVRIRTCYSEMDMKIIIIIGFVRVYYVRFKIMVENNFINWPIKYRMTSLQSRQFEEIQSEVKYDFIG